jgi:glycosyltransferase involved in cell wall biosynthesis
MTSDPKKNILFFSPYFYPYLSGLTTYPYHLFKHLGSNMNLTVLTFPHTSTLPQSEKHQDINIIRMPYWFKISKGFISPQSIRIFYTHVKNADHVLINLPSAEGIWLVLLAKLCHKPVTAIYHCRVDLGPAFFSKIITFALNRIIDVQLSCVNKVIGYTQDYIDHQPQIKKHLHKTIIMPPPVPPLIPDQNFLKQLLQQKKGHVWIGFSGRIAREKGLEYVIRAISQLPATKPVMLVCAGPYGKAVAGEEGYYQSIQQLLHQTNIPHLLLGPLSSGRLGSFYQAIDMLVLPSINHTEAFGMVQVEAMRLGTPVIASNLPGVRVPVQKTGMGLIVEPKNIQQLSDAIESILKNPNEYISLNKKESLKKHFNETEVYRYFENLINQDQ